MPGRIPFTVEEIISTIQRSSLPFILVEDTSKEMAEVYRKIESKIGTTNASIIPCGGRRPLLEIYKRRNEFTSKKVAYIADKDMWVFSGVPNEFDDICFTKGYSIENDLYADGKEQIEVLLEDEEIVEKGQIFQEIIQWYSSKVDKYLGGTITNCEFSDVTFLNKSIFDRVTNKITEQFKIGTGYTEPKAETVASILANYSLQLRGKFLFQVLYLLLFENRKNPMARYHTRHLLDICLRHALLDEHSNITQLVNCLKTRLGIPS